MGCKLSTEPIHGASSAPSDTCPLPPYHPAATALSGAGSIYTGRSGRRGPHVSGQHVTSVFSSDPPISGTSAKKNYKSRLYCLRLSRRNCHHVSCWERLSGACAPALICGCWFSIARWNACLTVAKRDVRSSGVMGRVKS